MRRFTTVAMVLVLMLASGFIVSGCRTAKTKNESTTDPAGSSKSEKAKDDSAKPVASNQAETLESEFVIGKTTKDEVIAKLGKPSGVGKNEAGEETLTYNRSHPTGKAFNPFYFGGDRFRTIKRVYIFNKDGVLTKFNTDEQHY